MTALSGRSPAAGVRYTFALAAVDGAAARYDVTVETVATTWRARVRIDAASAALEGDDPGLDPAHCTQLLALAKTIGKRSDDAPWPRRVERWRAPGVR